MKNLFTAVLALAVAFMLAPVSGNGHFCSPLLSSASGEVAASAGHGQLLWATDEVLEGSLGRARYFPSFTRIVINYDLHKDGDDLDDYAVAMTMAHEGLHAHFGPAPFSYLGETYTRKRVRDPYGSETDSVPEHELLIREIIGDCFEPEEEEEEKPECDAGADCGGNQPPEPVCEEKQVSENYTEYELQDRTAEVCYNYRTFGGTQISTFCVDISFKVYVSVEKTRMVTKTVCQN
ncbi:MAG: hypothetical protein OXI79_09585 [Gammaproteobacteria bacterium]|nr:hypothetical protein [Gammaproteobacteria bacterium]